MSSTSDGKFSQIFLSCDLTGSTDFKQNPSTSVPWQKVFLQFYREFPQRLMMTIREAGLQEELAFDLWKPVGDELIYSCKVRSERDIYHAVRVWTQAMADYAEFHLDDTNMGTKGGAFIATFPGPDSESTVPRTPETEDSNSDADVVAMNRHALRGRRAHTKYLYDYFGPSIDTGFRVLNRCTPRYFTLSVEVALGILSYEKATLATDSKSCTVEDLVLLELAELKGVWGGRKYPVFAIDLDHEDEVNRVLAPFEQRLGGDTMKTELLQLCETCYFDKGWPSALYLPDSASAHWKREPMDPLADYAPTTIKGAEELPEADQPDAKPLAANPPMA